VKHVSYTSVEAEEVLVPGADKVRVRWLIDEADGAPHFYMRRFELEPGGRTPRHTHPWEHEVYVLEGEGGVFCEGSREGFRPGDVVFIRSGEEHSFAADQGRPAAFLCLIPKEGKRPRA
jgi:quercetin dioxygenase-like cupin family protein